MKIKCFGWRNKQLDQISRIEQGFIELGHELISDNPDLIYCNDSTGYDLAIPLKEIYSNAKLIFNVLDIGPHTLDMDRYDISHYSYINNPYGRNFNVEKLINSLNKSDSVTCICDEVKWQLKNWCEIEANTIYNPIHDVSNLNLSKEAKMINGKKYKYLFVGRIDCNKRFNLIKETLDLLGEDYGSLAVIGPDYPNIGDYFSVVNTKILNLFYNSVDYLFFPSAFKSIGLPAIEAVVAGCKPIVCNDDPCTHEFFSGIGVDANPKDMADCILNPDWNNKVNDFIKNNSNKYKEKFTGKAVAQKIIDIYEKIKN